LIIILFVLLMVGLFYSESLGAMQWDYKAPKELDEEVIASESAQPKEGALRQEAIIRPKIEYTAQGLKDPFQSFVSGKETISVIAESQPVVKPLPVLIVQGLIWGGDFPQAIINNKVLKKGDSIEEAEVVAIEKEGVTLLYAGKMHKLPSPSVMGPRIEEQIKGGTNEIVR